MARPRNTPEEMGEDNVQDNVQNEAPESPKPTKKHTHKTYEEWRVDAIKQFNDRNELSHYEFEKIKKLRSNIVMEPWRIERLNDQSQNSLRRYYEQD